MTGRKSLGTCVLLLGLLLGTASSAHADAISITSLTLSNFQVVPTSGTITFFLPRNQALARTTNSLNQEALQLVVTESQTTAAQASANVTFASASAVADPVNFTGTQNSNATLSGCNCEAFAVGQTVLQQSFIITGGTGNVDVQFSGLLVMMQTVMTDQFGSLAESNVLVGIHLGSNDILPFTLSTLRVGPNGSMVSNLEQQLSQTLTLQFNTEYRIDLTLSANSQVVNQAEIPEPASVVLLLSGLGFMAGLGKKRFYKEGN